MTTSGYRARSLSGLTKTSNCFAIRTFALLVRPHRVRKQTVPVDIGVVRFDLGLRRFSHLLPANPLELGGKRLFRDLRGVDAGLLHATGQIGIYGQAHGLLPGGSIIESRTRSDHG